MPIFVTEAEFTQSLEFVFIKIPLHNHSKTDVDVTIFEQYVKVSYPPYIFETFLSKNVVDLSSSVRFESDSIVLVLKKQVPDEQWNEFQLEIKDKAEIRRIREDVLKRLAETAEERRKAKAEAKAEAARENVRQQMKLEQSERERIALKKDLEKRMAFSSVYDIPPEDVRDKIKEQPPEDTLPQWPRLIQPASIVEISDGEGAKLDGNRPVPSGKAIFDAPKTVSLPVPNKPEKALPPVRGSSQKIEVKFTHRVFPTPSRESQAAEEEEWLKKQAEARKIIEIDEKELSEIEKDPDAMRSKADEFYKQGNILAAINAYTQALRLRPNQPALYSNRAACHLRVNNLMKCVEDSSKALELFVPAVDANARERMLVHIRRGTALAKLELVVEGLADYSAALKLMSKDDPLREAVERDAETMRNIIQSSS